MLNDLRIAPTVATPRMWSEMFRIIKEEGKDCQEAYQAAIAAAPDYSHLVIVEKSDWRRTCDKEAMLFEALLALEAVVASMNWSTPQGERAYNLAKAALNKGHSQ